MIMLDTPFDTHDDRYRRDAGSETDAGRVISGDHPIIEETPPPTRRRLWPVVAAMVVVGGLSWWVLGGEDAPAVAPPVPVVTVAVPLQREITEWDEFIGRFEASRSVEVRPRVSGQVTAVHFTDGQYVQAGTALFTIDTRAYRANLAEAQARVASSSAALELARSNLARAQRLVEEDAVAANEIDRLRAEVRANEAAMAAAQRPVTFSALTAPSGKPAWRSVPSFYLLGTDDHIVPPALQRSMAEHAGAQITDVASGHLPMITDAKAVEALIVKAGR